MQSFAVVGEDELSQPLVRAIGKSERNHIDSPLGVIPAEAPPGHAVPDFGNMVFVAHRIAAIT